MHKRDMLAPKPVLILVRPQLAENIGMCARAMANFGLETLRLVAPRDGWPQKARLKKGAVSAAAGATGLLERAELFESVEAACADLHRVYATTARGRGQAKPVLSPKSAMAEMRERLTTGQRVGILFGPERTGLSNEDVALASAVITFPVNPDFASLNLAQAVLLMGYEWFSPMATAHGMAVGSLSPDAERALAGGALANEAFAGGAFAQGGHPAAEPLALPKGGHVRAGSPGDMPARRASLFAFFDDLEAHLARARYFWPQDRRPVMQRNLRNLFHKMDPTEQDIRTLRGMVAHLIRPAKAEGEDA